MIPITSFKHMSSRNFVRNALLMNKSINNVSFRSFSTINSYLRNSSSSSSSPIKIDPDTIVEDELNLVDKTKIHVKKSSNEVIDVETKDNTDNDASLINTTDSEELIVKGKSSLSKKKRSLKLSDERSKTSDSDKGKTNGNIHNKNLYDNYKENLKYFKNRNNKRTMLLKRKFNRPVVLQDLLNFDIVFHPDYHKFSYSLGFKETFDCWNQVPIEIIKGIDPLYVPKVDDEINVVRYKKGRCRGFPASYMRIKKMQSS